MTHEPDDWPGGAIEALTREILRLNREKPQSNERMLVPELQGVDPEMWPETWFSADGEIWEADEWESDQYVVYTLLCDAEGS